MADTCPCADRHTPVPEGYAVWHEWAERHGVTHRQKRCPGCGLWLIWEPKEKADPEGASE